MIQIITADNLKIPDSEVLRYLGMPKNTNDKTTLELIEECKKDLNNEVSYKACVKIVDIKRNGEELDFGGFKTSSKALNKNLAGCKKAVLFCATIGISADRLIMRYSKVSPVKSVITDAVASAMIESFCDFISKQFSGKPRFSCGFADFGLFYQRYFIEMLDATKKIGVTLTDGDLMWPTKSVTAVIGLI